MQKNTEYLWSAKISIYYSRIGKDTVGKETYS